MSNDPITHDDNEINLAEVLAMLWAYKFLIVCISASSIFLSGYYALNLDKQYTARATFKLSEKPSGISLSGGLESLTNLTGLGIASDKSNIPLDEVMGREFIEKLDQTIGLRSDPFFNNYNPNVKDPAWKSLVKTLIGWTKIAPDPNEAIWQQVVLRYRESIFLSDTDNGALQLKVTHRDPVRSAKITNEIMDAIIRNSKEDKDTERSKQLDYLARTLANALSELESTQSNLKNFTLVNTTLPMESFTAGTVQLDVKREELKGANSLYDALKKLSELLSNETIEHKDYLALRESFPVVDKVEFRRVLGQSEIISSWTWPDLTSVKSVFNTLSERKKRLEAEVLALKLNAEMAGKALEEYSVLEREAEIAEATYTVLIEQVKAQSMIAGFQPDNSKIFEYAAPPLAPSAPNRSLILAIGGILGLLFSCGTAFLISIFRGIIYSKRTLISITEAHLNISAGQLKSVRKRGLKNLDKRISNRCSAALRNLAVEIHRTRANQVALTSFKSRLCSMDLAKALATYMQTSDLKVGIIYFSEYVEKPNNKANIDLTNDFLISEEVGKVSILRLKNYIRSIDLFGQKDFGDKLKSLDEHFDLLFLCADNADALSMSAALSGRDMVHITVARLKKTKSKELDQVRTLLPIQGLLHE